MLSKLLERILPVALCAVIGIAATTAHSQFTFSKVALRTHIDLATFGADNGNGCWGYVSPSGREYAIMGLSNKVAFVEITDPAKSDWFASIPHANGLWADIKVYGNYAYVVTEESGSGIQVIDMSNIDNHIVTLVRTITSVGRSHTCQVDETSGYLYTCGSNEGNGTTTVFSLANPANPQRVGVADLTGGDYMHEAMIHTYTSGPYAGRQIFFGCGTDRGVEIYDVTNKNAPFLIKRVTYPDIGYCHQAWISEDLKYLYMDDEFDEDWFGFTSRTIVFDVSSLENATYLTSFTTGLNSVDHNLYVRDGFIYESNYTTGLRVFDANDNPTAPTQVGWFDTHPESNGSGYQGLWSNYPFFPSGTVIGSDINRGLFVWDVTEAVTRVLTPTSFTMARGTVLSGNLASLASSDDNRLTMRPGAVFSTSEPAIQLVMDATAPSTTPRLMKFRAETRGSVSTLIQKIDLYNFTANAYETLDTRNATTGDAVVEVTAGGNLARFVNSNKQVRARISYRSTSATFQYPWTAGVDFASWSIAP
ncbi:MAG: choice-of-anchor B family protein [Fimbriimonadales bacterium]